MVSLLFISVCLSTLFTRTPAAMASKPIILPDSFSGESNWEQWLLHFNDCADVNQWDADNKLRFLKVRLTGRAQAVFHRLSDTDKASFQAAVVALEAHFEPKGKRELYLADFSAKTKKSSESWVEYADELQWLAAKAYPDLNTAAHEQLALTHFLSSITDPQVVLLVKQKNPETLAEAVTAILQTESILTSTRIASTACDDESSHTPARSDSREDKLVELLTKLSDKIDGMNIQSRQPRYTARPSQRSSSNSGQTGPSQQSKQPVVCYRCHKEGHFARGCALPRQPRQGNEQPPAS